MLGKTKSYIVTNSYLPRSVGWYESEELVNDSTTCVQLVDREDRQVHFRYYINKTGICDYYLIMQPKTQMASWVQSLNQSYIKTKDAEWVTKTYDMVITIRYLQNEAIFTTGFSKLE